MMGTKELPVLNFGSFRKYPTKLTEQQFEDEIRVCHSCVSGVCCVNQDAIALSSFDIFRLAAFFDISPAQFMLIFTQDKFGDGDNAEFRRYWNAKPDSSVVTWLRRRANSPSSPCIFLKYIRDAEGMPRRICSVHDARPLSCREYYFAHCKTRGTGELAALLAEGFEQVRDGEITEDRVDGELARFGDHDFATSSLAENMEYGYWVEMKCVLRMDEANAEGSNSYDISEYQDPIDEKLNRVLSSKYLRSEESYGRKPRDEQLMPYTSGLGFADSSERERILRIAGKPPSTELFNRRNYPHYVGLRTLMPGVHRSELFPRIPEAEINGFIGSLPDVQVFPNHSQPEVRAIGLGKVCAAVLKAYNYVLGLASHTAALEPILESEPPGTIELEFFRMLVDFETSWHPFLAKNPHLEKMKLHTATRAIEMIAGQLETASTDRDIFESFKSVAPFYETTSKLPVKLRARVEAIKASIDGRLGKDQPELYFDLNNPIAERRNARKRLDVKSAYNAWAAWYSIIDDVRFASLAGFAKLDLSGFYKKAVRELEQLEFRNSYSICLFDTIKYLARSMTANYRICYRDSFKQSADRLASYANRFLDWQTAQRAPMEDCEVLADFAVAQRHLGRSLCGDEYIGSIIYRILDLQLGDGSWKTNLSGKEAPDDQAEFLEQMYRPTSSCINALRLTRNELLNPANNELRKAMSPIKGKTTGLTPNGEL